MTELIACLSSGKGTWMHVKKLIESENWEKVFLIANEFGKENFKTDKEVELIVVDFKEPMPVLIEKIKNALKGQISSLEVALNLYSGEGKEHMAILAALIQLGAGFRLVIAAEEGIKEI